MSAITTHVLDTAAGRPASGIRIRLERLDGTRFEQVGTGTTDADGRLASLLESGVRPERGAYRLTFETAAYFGDLPTFYPRVTVDFVVSDPAQHYHVPLLLSPFGYSTYRGS